MQLDPASRFRCRALGCTLRVGCCLLRQAVSRRQRTTQISRGVGGDFPSCSDACAQGAEIRRAVALSVSWRGHGPGGRFEGGPARGTLRAQLEARWRLQVVGLLEPVPSMDEPPAEEPKGEEDSAPV